MPRGIGLCGPVVRSGSDPGGGLCAARLPWRRRPGIGGNQCSGGGVLSWFWYLRWPLRLCSGRTCCSLLSAVRGVWGTTNNGDFVDPPLTAEQLHLVDAHGWPFVSGGRWWLWVTAPQGCGLNCEAALAGAGRLRSLLHKDADRVRRGLLLETLARLPQRAPDVLELTGDLGLLKAGVYIVDPLGNLVLWYSYDDIGKPVLDDLKRLLKVSQIG